MREDRIYIRPKLMGFFVVLCVISLAAIVIAVTQRGLFAAAPSPGLGAPRSSGWVVDCYPVEGGIDTSQLRRNLQVPPKALSADYFEYVGRGKYNCSNNEFTVLVNRNPRSASK